MAEAKIKTAYDIADESNLPIDIVSQPALLLLLLLLRWSQLGALRPAELRTPHCCSCVAGSDQYGNGRGGCYCDLAGKLVTQEEEER
jgi:hypothetical protein